MFLYKIPKINLENHDFLKTVKTQNFGKIFSAAGTEKVEKFFLKAHHGLKS